MAEIDTVSAEARDIMSFTLVARDGGVLPACEPGGHIEISLPNGLTRHYSLINDCRAADHYLFAVGRPDDSRGGSDHIHAQFRLGTPVRITTRSRFR